MNLKHISIIAALLLLLVHSYQTEGEVLVLKDSDFPKVLRDHPYILIEFYAPWYFYSNEGVDIVNNLLLNMEKLLLYSKKVAHKVITFLFSKIGKSRCYCPKINGFSIWCKRISDFVFFQKWKQNNIHRGKKQNWHNLMDNKKISSFSDLITS